MAKPRIFVSSTFYDFRVLRADISRFIREIGYEPVLFEQGHVPYGKDEALEEYCYREIATCDIVVNIIGGKIGTVSRDGASSITQKELRKALAAGKQIYIFIEKAVLSEFRTWQQNKEGVGFKPVAVNDTKIYAFIEEVMGLPSSNPVEGFDTSEDIARFLKEQFAGLFQRLLQDQAREKELNIVESLASTASTLNHLVTYLTEERTKGDQAIKDILLSTHPAFAALKKAAKIQYRVVFHTLAELHALLGARGYSRNEIPENGFHEWDNFNAKHGIRVSSAIFDEGGNLRIIKPEDWNDAFIGVYPLDPKPKPKIEQDDDEAPF
jgi:hypothetical protein